MIYREIEIRRHAFVRAMEQGIGPDKIEAALKGGLIRYFGENYIKFIKQYKQHTIICIGIMCGMKIKIITIEKK